MRNAISAGAQSGSACSTTHPSDSNVARCPSTTDRKRGSKGMPPRSLNQATRTPLKPRSSGRAKSSPGSLMDSGDSGWGPAIVLSANARSATERPKHPDVLSVDHANAAFGFGTRPSEGRKPTTLRTRLGCGEYRRYRNRWRWARIRRLMRRRPRRSRRKSSSSRKDCASRRRPC